MWGFYRSDYYGQIEVSEDHGLLWDASACRWVSVCADALGWRYFCVSLQGRAGRHNARGEVHAWRYIQGPVGKSGGRGRRGVYEACSVKWAEEDTCAGRGYWGSSSGAIDCGF